MGSKCFHIMACSLLGILFMYGIVGIVFNSTELTSNEGHGTWPYNQHPAQGAFIVIQCFYLVTMLLGIIALWRQEITFYYWSAGILLGVFVALFVFGIVCLRASTKDMSVDIFNTLKKTSGKDFEWFYMLQYEHKCCGVSSFNDWMILKTGLANNSVPETCCLREPTVPKQNCGSGVLSSNKSLKEIEKLIYIEPCGSKLSPIIRSKSLNLGMEMLIAAFASLGTATFLYCGATQLFCLGKGTRERNNQKRSRSALNASTELGEDDEEDEDGEDNDEESANDSVSRSNANNNKNSAKIGFGNKKGNTNGKSLNNSLKRAPQESGGEGMLTKKTKTGTKSKAFGKANKQQQQQIQKGLIDKNKKLQMSKSTKNSRKWKGTARVPSKALIFGARVDSKANFKTTNVKAQQNLEMLFEGLDKNVSTLSTTPNPSGSLTFPSSFSRTTGSSANKSPSPPINRNSTDRPVFPSLSHYSSLPLFHLVKFPNGEMGTLGQYSPHFVSNRNQRHTHRHTYFYAPQQQPQLQQNSLAGSPASIMSPVTVSVNRSVLSSQLSPVSPTSSPIVNLPVVPDLVISATNIITPLTSLNLDEIEIDIEAPGLYPSPASTTVRSSTLATIQEESESAKGTPKEASQLSPTGVEAMSPQLTNINMFGGSLIINDLSEGGPSNLVIRSAQIDEVHSKTAGRKSEEAVPLGPVGTGEFVPHLEIDEGSDLYNNKVNGAGIIATIIEEEDSIIQEDLDGNLKDNKDSKDGLFEQVNSGSTAEEMMIAEIGALAKARASKAQFRLGFD